jgi:hypothetical protein
MPSSVAAIQRMTGWRTQLWNVFGHLITTIRRIEAQPGPVMGYVSTVLRIQAAFEKAGIQFTEEDQSGGIGVRLMKKKR